MFPDHGYETHQAPAMAFGLLAGLVLGKKPSQGARL